MFDSAPDSIRTQLARRDNWVSADRFYVFLDPYHDKRTGFYFAMNASGVQYDGTLFNDDWDDNTWDGVWQGAVRRTPTGWTAEMRIPYSQLRFKPGTVPVWGINFKRDIARRNESDYLTFTPSNGSGFVSRFPELQGLELNPPRRIELLPYTTAKAEFVSHDPGDPYNDGSVYGIGVGGDFRVGLGSNLTINGTINPDFGQVEVDPAVVNLSDVETFFPERRPFFVEGANTFTNFGFGGSNNYWGFNWSSFDFIYTRRIGRAPTGATPDDASYVDEPGGTTILGALKLSGKMGGWNVGALVVADQAGVRRLPGGRHARQRGRSSRSPAGTRSGCRRTSRAGAQGIGFISTITQRFFNESGLPDQMNRGAYTLGVDGWTFLDEDRRYVLAGWFGSSLVTGTTVRMTDLQEGSVALLPAPRPGLRPRRLGSHEPGRVWRATGAQQAEGQRAAQRFAGRDQSGPRAQRRRLRTAHRPHQQSRRRRLPLDPADVTPTSAPTSTWRLFGAWDFGWDNTGLGMFANGNILFNNFWSARARINGSPETVNIRATRGGPAILNPPGFDGAVGFSSDDRKKVVLSGDFYYNRYQQGADNSWGIETYVEWRPTQAAPGQRRTEPLAEPDQRAVHRHLRRPDRDRHLWQPLRVRQPRPVDALRQHPAQLDLHAETEPRAVHAAVRVVGQLSAVLGACRAADLRLHRVRAGRLDLRPEHRHRGPGRPRWPGGADRHRRPELPVRLASRKRGAAVGVVTGFDAVRRVDPQPGQFDQYARPTASSIPASRSTPSCSLPPTTCCW